MWNAKQHIAFRNINDIMSRSCFLVSSATITKYPTAYHLMLILLLLLLLLLFLLILLLLILHSPPSPSSDILFTTPSFAQSHVSLPSPTPILNKLLGMQRIQTNKSLQSFALTYNVCFCSFVVGTCFPSEAFGRSSGNSLTVLNTIIFQFVCDQDTL